MKKAHYTEIEPEEVSGAGTTGVTVRWVISEKDGAENFFMRVFDLEPGGCTPRHSHAWEHEVFVLEGQGQAFLEGQEMPCTQGEVIFVEPNEEHQFRNTSDKSLKFICLIPKTK